jgi:hypothetical protein
MIRPTTTLQPVDLLAHGAGSSVDQTGKTPQRRPRPARLGAYVVLCAMLGGCASQTLFQSDFSPTPAGQPPAHAQLEGTANVDGPPGSVAVTASPTQTGSEKWVSIAPPCSIPNISVPEAAFQGNLAQFGGDGSYTFDALLFIPSPTTPSMPASCNLPSGAPTSNAVASVQFEQFDQLASDYNGFMHLDFREDGKVRIDDDLTGKSDFGMFPHDKSFLVEVTLNIGPSSSAHISLTGNGASGEKDYAIKNSPIEMAQQFGAIRLWMGQPWYGPYYATDIIVTKVTQKGCRSSSILASIRCALSPNPPTTVKSAD